ncbi:hypothetical protein QTP88_012913 [Uroleucon formosanum]
MAVAATPGRNVTLRMPAEGKTNTGRRNNYYIPADRRSRRRGRISVVCTSGRDEDDDKKEKENMEINRGLRQRLRWTTEVHSGLQRSVQILRDPVRYCDGGESWPAEGCYISNGKRFRIVSGGGGGGAEKEAAAAGGLTDVFHLYIYIRQQWLRWNRIYSNGEGRRRREIRNGFRALTQCVYTLNFI